MQVVRMFRAEAAIKIKQNGVGYIYILKGGSCIVLYERKTATPKHSFKSSVIRGRAKGGKKQRNCGRAGGEKDEYLKLLTMPRTILQKF